MKNLSVIAKTGIAFVIVVIVAVSAAIASFRLYKNKISGSQMTFVFPSAEKEHFIIERRNLPKSYIEPIEYYVNEILLGPQTERTERLFPKETKVLSCFIRNNVLYVDFSNDIINTDSKALSIKDSIDLFKKNVLSNFHSISEVEVYVDGNLAFAENSFAEN